ncbi:MAG: response regulator [bacterium]|nr:response regulator [bacterium]
MESNKQTHTRLEKSEVIRFADETKENEISSTIPPWKLLIVDDDESVHAVTRTIIEEIYFDQRSFLCLDAFSGKEAVQLYRENPDIALILLDVVMETEHAGLDVVHYIREEAHDKIVRIILYTGQPGQAPETRIIKDYDINDYKVKSMLTSQELYTAVISAIRTYRDLRVIEQQRDDLKQAMAEAQVAHKARYQFLANIGHELRTPLNHILGFAELMSGTPLTEKQQNYIDKMKKSGNDLCKVLNNILELSELIEGKIDLQESSFSLRRAVKNLVNILESQAQWKDLQLFYSIGHDVPDTIICDSKRLQQVLTNLIGNSIRYTQIGHIALTVSLQPSSDLLLFTIKDTGNGIVEEKQQYLFQPFALGEDTLQKEFSGVGLGLAISKNIVEKMKGSIWFESRLGQGSTFYFTISCRTI